MDLDGINPEDLPEELREKMVELGRELSEHLGEDSPTIKNPVDEDTAARHLRALHSLAHSGTLEDTPEDERGTVIPLAVIPADDAEVNARVDGGPPLDRSKVTLGSTGASFLAAHFQQNYGTPEVAGT